MTTTLEATYKKGVFVPKVIPNYVQNNQVVYITISTSPVTGSDDISSYLDMRKSISLDDITQHKSQNPGINALLSQRVGLGKTR